ncbi:MAG: T9SS type A sorting domain-containing protein [Ignavibacteria bacterium]|nr:T9SS type A sorting domain-containing protein [Ignavibacteria bacterium]
MRTRGRMLLCGAMLLARFCMATAQDGAVDISASGNNASGLGIVNTSVADIDKIAGEEVCFTLTAKDKNGNVIRSWNTSGNPTILKLNNSTANSDTSTRTWNSDPLGYSFATITHNGVPLTQSGPHEWSVPATEFDSLGQCRVCLTDTKAERGVQIEVNPTVPYLNQLTELMNFGAGGTTNYLVEITSHVVGKSAVYQMRPYELVVTPRDRFLNANTEAMESRFSARWPGEFDKSIPSLSDIFSGSVFITGPTNYFAASRIIRELPADSPQYIIVYKVSDQTINGRSDDFEVPGHAPSPFVLLQPRDHYALDNTYQGTMLDFTWEKPIPADPYTDIQTSRFDPRTSSDDVTYMWNIVDSISLTRAERIASNNSGRDPRITLSHGQIQAIMRNIAGAMVRRSNLVWFVKASDGLSTTLSSPPNKDQNQRPGFHIHIYEWAPDAVQSVGAPADLNLGQNYPNPFNPSTNIRFSVPATGRVTLRVFDLLGALVATPVNELLVGGTYHATFDASQLPSGTYAYTLQFGDQMLTKRMTVMK